MAVASSAETWKSWEGRVIDGKFALGKCLGGSGHSAVFVTERKQQPSQKVVIKLIAAEKNDVPAQLARWRAASQLSHPNLIRIFETGACQVNGRSMLYGVMEQAEEDLSQVLPIRPLSSEEVENLLPPVLDALSYLHGKGFVHGRLNPSNIHALGDLVKLSTDHVVSMNDATAVRRRGDVYDAPENAAGIISEAGDMWSLGVLLVAVLTQNMPQEGNANQGDPGLPSTLPQPFLGIARECLHLDPQRRCSIGEVRSRLTSGAQSLARPDAKSNTNRKLIYAAIAAALVLIVGIWALVAKRSTSRSVESQAPAPAAVREATSAPAPAVSEPLPAKTPSSPGEVVRQVLPEVSPSARRTIHGTIRMRVRAEVDPSGKVINVKLAAPSSSRYFSEHVLDAAKKWEFKPPQNDGQPAESTWMLQFRISRGGTQASAARVNH